MPVLLNGSATEVAAKAVQPALTMLEKTVIGSVLIIALALMIAAIYALIRVQNARVDDQKEASKRLEHTHSKMVEAFGAFRSTLEGLERSSDTTQKALQGLSREVSAVGGKVDLMIAMGPQRRREE